MSTKKQITLWVTPDEKETITGLAYGGNVSDYLRQLIRADAEQRGVEWPAERLDDTRGKYDRMPMEHHYTLNEIYPSESAARAAIAEFERLDQQARRQQPYGYTVQYIALGPMAGWHVRYVRKCAQCGEKFPSGDSRRDQQQCPKCRGELMPSSISSRF